MPSRDDLFILNALATKRVKERQPDDAPLLTDEQVLGEVAKILLYWDSHIRRIAKRVMCYRRPGPAPRTRPLEYSTQIKLLDRLVREGKLDKEVASGIKSAISGADTYAGTYAGCPHRMLDNLSPRNMALVFTALRKLGGIPFDEWNALPDETKTRVRALIKKLGSDDFAEREAAEKALREMGPVVAPALKEALKKPENAEQKQRIEKLLEEIQRNRGKKVNGGE